MIVPNQAEHFVLTRFNVRYSNEAVPRVLRDDWLEQRFELFERWCVPTLASQEGPTRRWLIFVDGETPSKWLERLKRSRANVNIEPVRVVGRWSDDQCKTLVRAQMTGNSPSLITTRIDNDDAVHRSYLETIFEVAQAGPRQFVNAPSGLRLQGERLYRQRDRHGPFLSLVEPTTTALPMTVFSAPHHRVTRVAPVMQLPGGPWWIQVIHSSNFANGVEGMPVRDLGSLRTGFDVDLPAQRPLSHLSVLGESFVAALNTTAHRMRRSAGRRLGR